MPRWAWRMASTDPGLNSSTAGARGQHSGRPFNIVSIVCYRSRRWRLSATTSGLGRSESISQSSGSTTRYRRSRGVRRDQQRDVPDVRAHSKASGMRERPRWACARISKLLGLICHQNYP